MSLISDSERAAVADFWQRLAETEAVMLGVVAPDAPFRPMRPFASQEECAVWFFTRRSSAWAGETGDDGAMAHLILASDGTYLDVVGRLETSQSPTHADRFWSAEIATLFEGGKTDPEILLLRFTPQTGRLWTPADGVASEGREVVIAGYVGELPGPPSVME
jgi:general stress protein 26